MSFFQVFAGNGKHRRGQGKARSDKRVTETSEDHRVGHEEIRPFSDADEDLHGRLKQAEATIYHVSAIIGRTFRPPNDQEWDKLGLHQKVEVFADHYDSQASKRVYSETRVEELKGEIEVDRRKHDAQITRLRQEHVEALNTQKQKFDDAINKFQEHSQQLQQSYEHNEEERRRTIEEDSKAQRKEHGRAMESLKIDHRQAMEINVSEHEKEASQFQEMIEHLRAEGRIQKQALETEKRRMQQRHEEGTNRILRSHREDADRLKQSHKDEINRLTREYEARTSQLAQEHEKRQIDTERASKQHQEKLLLDIKSRNKALMARETTAQLSDGELRSMFANLANEVDTLARTKWIHNHSPWTNEAQAGMTDSPKRLQKQILQDTIWTSFFEHIFCSPFKVFGDEGQALDAQWNNTFKNQDSRMRHISESWPEPSFDTEKWRYETMKGCQEAMRISPSKYDPRIKIRNGYQTSMDHIAMNLSEAFEMITTITDEQSQGIRALSEKAAKLWISFGTQRCRLFFVLQSKKDAIETGSDDRCEAVVEFVIRPELKRVGDSDGISFVKMQTVAGCEGETKKIRYGGKREVDE